MPLEHVRLIVQLLLAGSKRHYVTIEWGGKIVSSKITQGRGKKIWWNEKFRFPLSDAECRDLEKVTLTIMEIDQFAEDTPVGETKVHVGEVISEGSEREFLQMKPAPYNVVLEDGTYKGVLKLGIKFISSVSLRPSTDGDGVRWSVPARQPSVVGYGLFLSFACPSIPWRRLFFFCSRSSGGQSGEKDL
ncbi:elicitor-responsive protein 1-like [Setaria viridis]|uniref:elicitor-responsive protein 1-like n=1 Tax=Setaria viridis TaxID=4556 RepID=UPI003B3A83FA